MKDISDINLLSQVHALNRKFSIAREQVHLKKKGTDDNRNKNAHHNTGKPVEDKGNFDEEGALPGKDQDVHGNIEIIV